MQTKSLGQVYMQVKFLCRLVPPIGTILLQILKNFVYVNTPNLLKNYFNSIIYPLILYPEQPEENQLLLDFFQKEQIPSEQIIYLINIFLEKDNTLYNYVTVKFILLKYATLNPFFSDFDFPLLKKSIEDRLKSNELTFQKKMFIY